MSVSAAILSIALALHSAVPAPAAPVRPLYSLDRQQLPHIDAVEYPLEEELHTLFSVPRRNAVGTNSLDNAITVLDLSGPKVRYRELRRSFKKYVFGGDMRFLPPVSENTIGYSQTRGFLLFDIKTGAFRDFMIGKVLEQQIDDVAVLDGDRRIFLFNVSHMVGMDETVSKLMVLDLSASQPRVISEFRLEKDPRWAELGKTTFYFAKQGDRLVLHALDHQLKPVDHPLRQVYNSGSFKGAVDLPVVHPRLPLAVFAAESGPQGSPIVVWAVSWGSADGRPVRHPISISDSGSFRFSPDGSWLLFEDATNGPDRFVAMPVDPTLPHFLGKPILLRTRDKIPPHWNGKCAWIADPVSVVCTIHDSEYIETTGEFREINKLLKWELSPANVKK